ncbi:reverse transcriptase domain-containing protein [Tanacetum coccineum]
MPPTDLVTRPTTEAIGGFNSRNLNPELVSRTENNPTGVNPVLTSAGSQPNGVAPNVLVTSTMTSTGTTQLSPQLISDEPPVAPYPWQGANGQEANHATPEGVAHNLSLGDFVSQNYGPLSALLDDEARKRSTQDQQNQTTDGFEEDTPLHDRSNPHKSSRRRVNQEDSVFNRLGSRFPRSIVIGPQNQEEPPREGGERRVNTDNGFGIQHQGQEQGTDTRKYRNGRDGRTPPRRNRRSPSNSSPCSSSDSDRSIRRKRSNSPKGPSSSDSSSSSEDRNPRHRSSKRTKRKESLPWRRQKTDAFVKSIRTYSDKEKRRLPSQVKTYDGKGDPDDHLNVFETVATNENWPEAIWCRQFNSTLVEHARTWFDKLPKRSIGGYEDLRRAFMKNFTPRKKCVKNPVELARVKQRQGETTDAFMDRYKDELLQVKNCLEILQISGFMNGINNQDLIKKLNDKNSINI